MSVPQTAWEAHIKSLKKKQIISSKLEASTKNKKNGFEFHSFYYLCTINNKEIESF